MKRASIAWLVLFCWNASPAGAQDWTAVMTLPADARVRVVSQDGRVHGRVSSVDDAQLTVIARGTPIAIPRAAIVRLERERRDALWNGLIIGALASLAMRVAFGSEACSRTPEPRCTLQGVLVGTALGAFVDYQVTAHPVIYAAPAPSITLLRRSF